MGYYLIKHKYTLTKVLLYINIKCSKLFKWTFSKNTISS